MKLYKFVSSEKWKELLCLITSIFIKINRYDSVKLAGIWKAELIKCNKFPNFPKIKKIQKS